MRHIHLILSLLYLTHGSVMKMAESSNLVLLEQYKPLSRHMIQNYFRTLTPAKLSFISVYTQVIWHAS